MPLRTAHSKSWEGLGIIMCPQDNRGGREHKKKRPIFLRTQYILTIMLHTANCAHKPIHLFLCELIQMPTYPVPRLTW